MSDSFSYLSHLECPVCGQQRDPARLQTFCEACGSPLLARYDLAQARARLDRSVFSRRQNQASSSALTGMWRWHELLPVGSERPIITLGEGNTPTLPLARLGAELGLERLYLKDESLNPTGTFKARGLSAAISKAAELGIERVAIPTAGNAGGALAAYAARAGMHAVVAMPQDTPSANVKESRIAGAETILVDGLISDAAVLVRKKAQAEGYFDVSTFKEPYRAEGKKIMGYEIAESFGWQFPDLILYPAGGGTGLVGIWKAVQELAALGWLETGVRPRMVAVQAEGCAPVVKAYQQGSLNCEFWQNAATAASGLRVPRPFADRLILAAIRESGGEALAVSEEAIFSAQRQLARSEGIFAAPEGAATLAGLDILIRERRVDPSERVLLLNTGAGLKYLELV